MKVLVSKLTPNIDKLPAVLAGLSLLLVLLQVIIPLETYIGYIFLCMIFSILVALALKKKFTLGPLWLVIPMGIIIGVIILRVLIFPEGQANYNIGFVSLLMMGYLAARICGKDILWVTGPAVILLSLAVIIRAGLSWPIWITTYNYNLVVAIMILGTILCPWRQKWLLIALVLPSIFLTGASIGLVAIGAIVIIMILQRDWSRKILIPLALVGALIVGAVSAGFAQSAYERTHKIATESTNGGEITLGGRVDGYKFALEEFTLLGHGYAPQRTDAPKIDIRSIHNTPLRIFYELGPLAMGAWLFIMFFGILKTRWKYVFGVILALGMFDHMMWTWLAPLTFIILGVSTMDDNGERYLFRKEVHENIQTI